MNNNNNNNNNENDNNNNNKDGVAGKKEKVAGTKHELKYHLFILHDQNIT